MSRITFTNKKLYPFFLSTIIFFALATASINYSKYKKGLWKKDIRTHIQEILSGERSKLEKALYSRIFYTRGVAAFVSLKPDITNNEFYLLAHEYMRNDSVINTMSLSKNCIINAIYPVKGHESAIGLNLLTHPKREKIVKQTIKTEHSFIAGPVKLVEGGCAFISYTPIFDKTKNIPKFWGLTDIVIKKNNLLTEAGLLPKKNGYKFALRGYDGLGENGSIFWGDKKVFEETPVTVYIDLPIGKWQMGAVPINGWESYHDQDQAISTILLISAFIISLLIGFIFRALIKVKQNEKELKAIFASLDSLIIEMNHEGYYKKIATKNQKILYKPIKKLIGKNLKDIFNIEKANFFQKSIDQCLLHKKLVVIEYSLKIDNKIHWFSSRISYKNQDSVILNAYDITEKKIKEERLKKSEQRLKEMNDNKNKLFSVIAHDLRSPLSSQEGLTQLLLENYDQLPDIEIINNLLLLKDSTHNILSLLDNLLKWSASQSGKIKAKKIFFNPYNILFKISSQIQKQAASKNIQVINNLNKTEIIWADPNLTSTIILNLASNAIKFTHPGGLIQIYSKQITKTNSIQQIICVKDNGIGIKEEKMSSLFKFDKATSLPGTANEQGTGLGLLLCKEFIELQGGQIVVESKEGEGSIFSIILPLPKKLKTNNEYPQTLIV